MEDMAVAPVTPSLEVQRKRKGRAEGALPQAGRAKTETSPPRGAPDMSKLCQPLGSLRKRSCRPVAMVGCLEIPGVQKDEEKP